ncbi:MAG: orotidine-5'-phosphate decarboxylase [Chloroflexi bacterium]|nr:orotidine-5'-phosphate decarboxylase [Chloroflexota bacterium]
MTFIEKLQTATRKNNSRLCVGLDPHPDRIPAPYRRADNPVLAFNRAIIEATVDLVCAYKPNFAFYEAQGPSGLETLRQTIQAVPPEIPVILDAKRGDIGSTAQAYAQAAFEVWGADAVTVNPYLGRDSLAPFQAYEDRGVFLLCHTSNAGATDLQTLWTEGRPLYETVAELATRWNRAGNLGLVVGATFPDALRRIRAIAPTMPILLPGVGTQGGDLAAALAAGLTAEGDGLIVNASRSVIFAGDPRAAATALRDDINAAAGTLATRPAPGGNRDLVDALNALGCVQFGDFTLASGLHSPVYIDLRLLVSDPAAMHLAARAYARLLAGLSFDRLAAIPYAALPIGAVVAQVANRPLIYPRKEVKSYGRQRAIEGRWEAGETVVVLDDLITTGGSKLAAIEPLEQAGLHVRDVVVLIDREQGGADELAAKGYRLHSVLKLSDLRGHES